MPPKGKKTKAEEALDFLSNLDNLDAPGSDASAPPSATSNSAGAGAANKENAPSVASGVPGASGDTPRASFDSSRKSLSASRELGQASSAGGSKNANAEGKAEDEEAQKALDFLQAQINQKRAPLSKPLSSSTPRSATPVSASVPPPPAAPAAAANAEPNVPSSPPTTSGGGGGWGVSSFWSTATSALQSAQKVADEQYRKVRTEGVSGVTNQLENLGVKGVNVPVDLNKLRKGAEERLGGIVKGVDLEKLRQDLVNTTTSTLTSILDTVAPPISAHETLELWLTHPMVGYSGVEGVIYRAWVRILEQTESGELIVVWSPPAAVEGEKTGSNAENDGDRSINPIDGWEKAWVKAKKEIEDAMAREEKDPRGRSKSHPSVPVTTVPIFLHLQPLLAPLPYPEPPILTSSTSTSTPPKHLQFLLTLQDPTHSLVFTTVSQPTPSDWMEVEYERSEWVEDRLVEVLRTAVEVIAQDYVATRMGLKPSALAAALVEQATQESNQAKAGVASDATAGIVDKKE
ncbi:hypothetical protein I316_06990 [Kwoniella heveanensis BCC8398]|uniref:Maintenance of telomere capping protein 1 n=1 Tax=Kwoniella heveanensis BCC8398 TaxID=1296120 RepID=A0A1B9GKA9_9TREE|nr:hypothetical protein I316_06990 [Kwoniella heveanensis BCC8398]